jgi:hypothetical protein
VLVNVDEGNNEGVGDDVLDMEKIVTLLVADNLKGHTDLCTRMQSMLKDQNPNSSKSSTPHPSRNSRHQLATYIHGSNWTTTRIQRI